MRRANFVSAACSAGACGTHVASAAFEMAELPSKTTNISRYAVRTTAHGILRSYAVRRLTVGLLFAVVPLLAPARADAADRLCDTRFEDCRAPLISLINSEPAGGGIDVAFWFMTDDRYR